MFTGIVERTSAILEWADLDADGSGDAPARRLTVARDPLTSSSGAAWDDLERGESIAVNGVCLTLVDANDHGLSFDVIPETLACSALGDLVPGAPVHLERALRVGDRLGGHYVLGHVDGVGRVTGVRPSDGETVLEISVESSRGFRVIPKGSVAIDGVSLTIVDRDPSVFSVALVPHTLAVTRLGRIQVGDRVNLEMDHIGKWVMELLKSSEFRVQSSGEQDAGSLEERLRDPS